MDLTWRERGRWVDSLQAEEMRKPVLWKPSQRMSLFLLSSQEESLVLLDPPRMEAAFIH